MHVPGSDRILVTRIQQGDVGAFAEMFHLYWTDLCIAAAMYTRDMADAEEMVSAIFADMWERRTSLVVTVKLRTYLHAAVKHRAINWQRDCIRRARLMERASPASVPGMGEHPPVASDIVERDEALVRAASVVNTLPDRYRIAFLYRWRDGWDYADIAHVLGVSVNTAQVLVSRAIRMIRGRLGEG